MGPEPVIQHLPLKSDERFKVFGTPAAGMVKSECGFVEVSETKGVSKMTQERQKRGNPYKRGDTWTIDYSFEDPTTGKKIRKRKGGFATKKEAEKALAIKKAKILQGDLSEEVTEITTPAGMVVSKNILLKDYAQNWLLTRKNEIAYNTYSSYFSVLKTHVYPLIGELKLCTITRNQVQNVLLQAPNSLSRRCKIVLNLIFKSAIIDEIISKNPCQYTNYKPDKSNKRKTLTLKQTHQLVEAVKKYRDTLEPYVILGLYLGLRYGEISGLKYSDFDLKTHEVKIVRQIAPLKKGVCGEKSPKTAKGVRKIYLPRQVEEYIKERRALLIGNGCFDDTYVVSTTHGEVPNFGSHHVLINTLMKSLCQELGFGHITLHCLRHTCATLLIQKDVSIKKVSDMLGHAKINTTLDIYCDALQGQKDVAVAIESIFDIVE